MLPEGVKWEKRLLLFPEGKGISSDGDEKLGIIQQCSEEGRLHYFFFTSEYIVSVVVGDKESGVRLFDSWALKFREEYATSLIVLGELSEWP